MNSFKPWQMLHLELSQGVPDLSADDNYQGLYLVLFWEHIPLGHLELPMAQLPLPAAQLTNLILPIITPAIGCHLLRTGFQGELPVVSAHAIPPVPPDFADLLALKKPLTLLKAQAESLPPESCVSVIVCTRDRPEALKECLRSLQALTPSPLEILVVDNAPRSDATYQIVSQMPKVRYVREPQVGLSAARNRGIRESVGSILAFTDDDVVVHPQWTARLQQAFCNDRIMAVTGLVLPTNLETESQFIFEKGFGGFGQGYRTKIFDSVFFETIKGRGVPVWKVGAGANMAFRRRVFEQVGEFDERLGAGRSGCSEDSELWYRILATGGCCQYEPKAVVYHTHRRDLASLKQQMYQYMRGHVVALLIQFERYQHWGNVRRLAIALPRYYLSRILSRFFKRNQPPTEILVAEIWGCFAGVRFYLNHRQRQSNHQRELKHQNHQTFSTQDSLTDDASNTSSENRLIASSKLNSESLMYKQQLKDFLSCNPFPHPLTEGFFYREKMRAIHRIAPDLPFETILEVGGGRGGLTALLYPHSQITNLDLDSQYANAPCNQQARVRFVCGNATALPFEDQTFDAVTMFDVLEHIPDHKTAIAEALRVLRSNGFLLVSTPNENWRFPYYALMQPICPSETDVMAAWGHVRRGYTLTDLEQLIGLPYQSAATFINPITVIGHDVAFSKLPHRVRRSLCMLLSPLIWFSYALHQPESKGTETASAWQKSGKTGLREQDLAAAAHENLILKP